MQGDFVSSCAGLVFTALTIGSASAQVFWINEFHYDNSGADVGEFVEIAAPATFTDLAAVQLTLYNGSDGNPYGSPHSLESFTRGETVGNTVFYYKPISGLQNGAPDGMSLDFGGAVQHFISYEGSFTASSGPAAGLASTDTLVAESESTPAGASLGLIGPGPDLSSYTWSALGTATPGALNPGQAAVPEPACHAIAAGLGLGALAAWRSRTRRMSQVRD
jgi:hypothetical protein